LRVDFDTSTSALHTRRALGRNRLAEALTPRHVRASRLLVALGGGVATGLRALRVVHAPQLRVDFDTSTSALHTSRALGRNRPAETLTPGGRVLQERGLRGRRLVRASRVLVAIRGGVGSGLRALRVVHALLLRVDFDTSTSALHTRRALGRDRPAETLTPGGRVLQERGLLLVLTAHRSGAAGFPISLCVVVLVGLSRAAVRARALHLATRGIHARVPVRAAAAAAPGPAAKTAAQI